MEFAARVYRKRVQLELETLLDLADEKVLAKGKGLFLNGAILEAAKGRNRLQAKVKGSMPFPYRVEINFAKGEWNCTCPYAWGSAVCKHVVAVAYAGLEAPEIFAKKKLGKSNPLNLEPLLELSDDELFRLLQQLHAERPELIYEFAYGVLQQEEDA